MHEKLDRRQAVAAIGGLLAALPLFGSAESPGNASRNSGSASPAALLASTPRIRFGMNPDWKFFKGDAPGAETPDFDDASWTTVGTPHTFNDVDTFDEITKGGEPHEFSGVVWYRKRFRLPPGALPLGGKVFLELEGLKQAAHFYLNGKPLGLYENGITACGIDLTSAILTGDADNILAVKVNSDQHYVEESTGVGFEWMSHDFNPNFGGLNHNVSLHVTGPVYQTLPLYLNLGTTGTYIYASEIDVAARRAQITVESQVHNASDKPQTVVLSVMVVDAEGVTQATLPAATQTIAGGETATLTASGPIIGVRLWDDREPYLYQVVSVLSIDGRAVDAVRTETGFRKTDFRGGAGVGGVYLNDRFVYLKGYAQRSTNEWAGLGQAYPDWMHDYHARLIRDSNANYIRWMHITPGRADVSACDRNGILQIMPAGDKEKDATGRQWEQRMEVMRASMIYLRNHPSILFYEAGNNGISAAHMREMRALREQWDPHGGRTIGCRSISDEAAVPEAGYYGTMVTEDARLFETRPYTAMFRGYSDERRDRAPLLEAEDFRDEAARRFWDAFSPPHFGFHKKPADTWDYNSETFCIAAVKRYNAYYTERISNPDPAHSKWSGYASIIFSDTNSHGRQYASEVCRVSGKVDAVRLPKQAYFVYRVLQNPKPDLHLVGHWTYPAATKKTVYVVSNADTVELFVNGKSVGKSKAPTDGYLFAFPNIAFQTGEIRAVGTQRGATVAEHRLVTAGPPHALRLTPIVSPAGFRADTSDVALFDVEVVDSAGRRCPTDEARVDFALTGPAIWRGGYNSGIPSSTNNLYLNTECGVNRVAIRATGTPGEITLTARRPGIAPASQTIVSQPAKIVHGLLSETMR